MQVITVEVPELGNRSYIVHDSTHAIAIDPSRRTQALINQAKNAHITIEAIFETHVHNDYVTGGYALAHQLGVPYYITDDGSINFDHETLTPDQTITIGDMEITAIAASGHTHHHTGYLVTAPKAVPAFFSGGSLLYGAVGRTDLLSKDDTKPLAHAQYQTAQHLLERLAPQTKLYPTHGFGSFCAAMQTEDVTVSTIAHQRRVNPVYTAGDEESFVQDLLDGLDVYPAYYARMAPLNAAGPGEPDLETPTILSREAVLEAMQTSAVVIDMRTRTAYAARHLTGTYNIEVSNDFATYVGWLIDWEAPLILVDDNPEAVNGAQEALSHIGRGLVDGQITSRALLHDLASVGSYPIQTFADLADITAKHAPTIVDVRRNNEWNMSHVRNALHIPLHELIDRMKEVPLEGAVWVYCASGFRASIAASILANNHRQVTLVDDPFLNAFRAGLVDIITQPYVDAIRKGSAQLIDVRDNNEWKTGHATNAIHLPIGQILSDNIDILDIDKPVYIYCESGDRSGMAQHFLEDMGYEATNIGSLTNWMEAGGAST